MSAEDRGAARGELEAKLAAGLAALAAGGPPDLSRAEPQARADSEARRALEAVVGVSDTELTGRLVRAGVGAESFAAFRFLPLVMVAWADGSVSEAERDAVLEATREVTGIGWGTPAYTLLEQWLDFPPSANEVALWGEYVRALNAHLDEALRDVVRERTLGDARAIAEAAGGLLGVGTVSAAETAVLEKLAEILA